MSEGACARVMRWVVFFCVNGWQFHAHGHTEPPPLPHRTLPLPPKPKPEIEDNNNNKRAQVLVLEEMRPTQSLTHAPIHILTLPTNSPP
jgi:hypothetical protein